MSDTIAADGDLLAPSSQRSPTASDRRKARQNFDPDFVCVCNQRVVLAFDWQRGEVVSLVRAPGHSGKFQVAGLLPDGFVAPHKGCATYVGWGGTHVKHECPGPAPRPEIDPASLPSFGFPGGVTDDEQRAHRAFTDPEWQRVDCRILLAGDRARKALGMQRPGGLLPAVAEARALAGDGE
jgi:hypothetical protein